jgi:anaerobic selenocysteine-containing dehydrogenase
MLLAETAIDPQVIIIFVAMIFAGIKALIEKAQSKSASPQEETPLEEYFDGYYEEALQQQRQQLGLQVEPPPQTVHQFAPTPELIEPPAPLPKVTVPKLSPAEKQALKNLQKTATPVQKPPLISTKSRLKAHLSSPTAAREALILSEVFGPPKALKK